MDTLGTHNRYRREVPAGNFPGYWNVGQYFVAPLAMVFARHIAYGDAITLPGTIAIFAFWWSFRAYCAEVGWAGRWPKTKADVLRDIGGIVSLCLPFAITYVISLFWKAETLPVSWFTRYAISLLAGAYILRSGKNACTKMQRDG